jgi:SAM-dependent methyltransferase
MLRPSCESVLNSAGPELTPGFSTSCPLCEATTVAPLYPTICTWKCSQCRLIFKSPQPTYEELSSLYHESYDPYLIAAGETKMAGTTVPLARQYVRGLSKTMELRGKRVLDFGAGLGTMSLALKERGAVVVAVEPFAQRECEKTGVTTFPTLHEVPAGLQFDLIVAIEVIEHLQRPCETLKELRKLLKPAGLLFLTTPNATGLRARVRGPRWDAFVHPGHLMVFAPRTLERALETAGVHPYLRPRWVIRYSSNPARALLGFGLQLLGLDGQLKYLARKALSLSEQEKAS